MDASALTLTQLHLDVIVSGELSAVPADDDAMNSIIAAGAWDDEDLERTQARHRRDLHHMSRVALQGRVGSGVEQLFSVESL
jgi:hypothetical protein